MSETKHSGLPVAGYKPQNEAAVAIVNVNKALEERVLRQLDALGQAEGIDRRWLAIEQGFMAVNRAVFQPGRVTLPED